MALETRKLLAQQGTTAVPVKTPAEDFRLNLAGLFTPGGVTAGVQVRSGVLPGAYAAPATRPCDVAVAAGGVFTIYPGRFVVQGSTANAGAFVGTIDAARTRTISGADLPASGQYKAGRLLVQVYDQTYGDTQDGWDLVYVVGSAAATVGAAVLPTQPGNSLQLRTFTVDSAGTITLGSALPSYTVARGGIQPVDSVDTTAGTYVGQYRDHPTYGGLQRWDGAGWVTAGSRQVAYAKSTGATSAAAFTNLADGNENRVTTAALNFTAVLTAGRVYRAEFAGTLQPAATGNQQVNLRGKSGVVTVTSADTLIAPWRQVISVAGSGGRSEIQAWGRFTVPSTGTYSFALFTIGASNVLAYDGRGLVDVTIDDLGPAADFSGHVSVV